MTDFFQRLFSNFGRILVLATYYIGPSSTDLDIGSIKNSSRIWVLQTHQKMVVEPDFWFRARDLRKVNSAGARRFCVVSLTYYIGPSSTDTDIDSIKNPSRIWVLPTHQKMVVKPDFWFRARDLSELNSPGQEFFKKPFTDWSSSWYRLPYDSRIVTKILFTFQ